MGDEGPSKTGVAISEEGRGREMGINKMKCTILLAVFTGIVLSLNGCGEGRPPPIVVVVPPEPPDKGTDAKANLKIDSMIITVLPDGTLDLQGSVKNEGVKSARRKTTLAIVHVPDQGTPEVIASQVLNPVRAAKSASFQLQVAAGQLSPSKQLRIRAISDSDNVIDESNELDNTAETTFLYGSDVAVMSVQKIGRNLDKIGRGEILHARATVQNIGSVQTGPFEVAWQYCIPVVTASGAVAPTWVDLSKSTLSLAPGQSTFDLVQEMNGRDLGLLGQTVMLRFVADLAGQVSEVDKSNNEGGIEHSFPDAAKADLVVWGAAAQYEEQGDSIRFYSLIFNNGDQASGQFQSQWSMNPTVPAGLTTRYRPRPGQVTPIGAPLQHESIPGRSPENLANIPTFTWQPPAEVQNKVVWLSYEADSSHVVGVDSLAAAADTTNETATSPTSTVTATAADSVNTTASAAATTDTTSTTSTAAAATDTTSTTATGATDTVLAGPVDPSQIGLRPPPPNSGRNVFNWAFRVPNRLMADLAIYSLQGLMTDNGRSLLLEGVIHNVGDYDSGPFSATLSVDNTSIKVLQLPSLPPGASTVTIQMPVPITRAMRVKGTAFLKMVVTPSRPERSAENNELTLEQTISRGADLSVVSVNVQPNSSVDSVVVKATVRNLGDEPSDAYRYALELTGLAGGVSLAEKVGLLPGDSREHTFIYPLAAGDFGKSISAKFSITPNAEDLHRRNNSAQSNILVLPPRGPGEQSDLYVRGIDVQYVNGVIQMKAAIANIGEGDAPGFQVAWYINGTRVTRTSGENFVHRLAAGAQADGPAVSYSYQPQANESTIQVVVGADPSQTINEVSVANNWHYMSVPVTPPTPLKAE